MAIIKKIRKEILKNEIPVYDITVDKYHNFSIGDSRSIVHNCEYLHGNQSLEAAAVTLAKNYTGSNNMNLIVPFGSFGTRHENSPAASRYIFTYKEKVFDKLFIDEDNPNLISQSFEGTVIEPRFFIPGLPLLLINGSEGIATGFAQKILPRNIDNIKKYIKDKLAGKKPNKKLLIPHYDGFNGKIKLVPDSNQVEIYGVFKRDNLTTITISEIPIGYNLKGYTKVLDSLEDKKIITSYKDLSDSKKDTFKFELKVTSKFTKKSDNWIIEKLKLVKRVSENFTVIDENNRIKVYESPEEIMDHFIRIKLEYVTKRKKYLLDKNKQELNILISKLEFVSKVTENKIIINKKKKDEIISQFTPFKKIIKKDSEFTYLLNMPIYSLTSEKIKELSKQIMGKKNLIKDIQNKSEAKIWEDDISKI